MTEDVLLTDDGLQELVEKVSLEVFGSPFTHQASYNTRLQTTGGRYHLQSHHLDFNPRVVTCYGEAELVKVIKHELCHYHLHLAGKGYRHRDRDFKQLLAASGGSRFTPPLTKGQPGNRPKHVYRCQSCEQVYTRQRRINLKKYGCRCGGRLQISQ